jgi:hypothetical protein
MEIPTVGMGNIFFYSRIKNGGIMRKRKLIYLQIIIPSAYMTTKC